MAIHYSLEQRGEVLYFTGEGAEEGLEENRRILKMVVQACEEHNCRLVLLDDRRVQYTISIISLYELARSYKEVNIFRQISKVALVSDLQYKEDNDFFETTSQNRGLNLRVFYDIEQAEAWLGKK
jgi:hypothetical protein